MPSRICDILFCVLTIAYHFAEDNPNPQILTPKPKPNPSAPAGALACVFQRDARAFESLPITVRSITEEALRVDEVT